MGMKLDDLRIYRKAEEIADRVWEECIGWDSFAKRTTGEQLVRATDSVGANIAEGYGRYHYKEQLKFSYYARGSLLESRFWLRRAQRRKLIEDEEGEVLIKEVESLAPQISAYISNLRKRSTT